MFFFVREKKSVREKIFWVFLSFFTHKKCFSRTNFIKISRTVRRFHGHFVKFFHAWAVFCFTGWNRILTVLCVKFFWKIWFSQIFHAQNWFFTGTFYDFFTERIAFSRKENQFFSRMSATFSRTKKNTLPPPPKKENTARFLPTDSEALFNCYRRYSNVHFIHVPLNIFTR